MKRILTVLVVLTCLISAASPTYARPRKPARNGKWGAIAYSKSTGRYGLTYDYPTQAKAINAAVERCRVNDCQAVVWFTDSCGAFAKGSSAYGWGIGNSRANAEENALASCRKRGGGCRIAAWSCTSH